MRFGVEVRNDRLVHVIAPCLVEDRIAFEVDPHPYEGWVQVSVEYEHKERLYQITTGI